MTYLDNYAADVALKDEGQDTDETKVIFRKWQGDIIALFPEELGDTSDYTCESYQHIGQHGAADCQGIIWHSKPAKPEEYADLKAELESIGYRLKVVHKHTQRHLATRRAKINAYR